MSISRTTIIKAFEGALIYRNPILTASGSKFSQEHADAINAVDKHYAEFCDQVLQELERWPLTKQYFFPFGESSPRPRGHT